MPLCLRVMGHVRFGLSAGVGFAAAAMVRAVDFLAAMRFEMTIRSLRRLHRFKTNTIQMLEGPQPFTPKALQIVAGGFRFATNTGYFLANPPGYHRTSLNFDSKGLSDNILT